MEKRAGGLLFWAVTILLITVTAFCCVETAASRTDLTRAELESCYREWERGIAEDIREYLGRQGYENSGVTLTRVTDEDGFREYTVSIHHSSIMEMGEDGRGELAQHLSARIPKSENCTFSMNFF